MLHLSTEITLKRGETSGGLSVLLPLALCTHVLPNDWLEGRLQDCKEAACQHHQKGTGLSWAGAHVFTDEKGASALCRTESI